MLFCRYTKYLLHPQHFVKIKMAEWSPPVRKLGLYLVEWVESYVMKDMVMFSDSF